MLPNSTGFQIFDSIHGDPPINADDKILNGDKFYVVMGCIVYTTFESTQRSQFC